MPLQDAEDAARVECDADTRHAIKALFSDATHRNAIDFIVHTLCGLNSLSLALPRDAAVMGWHAGRRFVATQLLDIVRQPIPEHIEPTPLRMTATERVRRRNAI